MKTSIQTPSLCYSEMLKLSRKLALIAIVLIANVSGIQSQVSNISGVINDYAAVTAIPCFSGAQLEVSSAAALSAGDKVLIIQMKGATIDETNSASFGTVTDYGSAGLYEINEVASKSGNTISLTNSLENAYDTDGLVQVVRIPEYDQAQVTGTLTAQPWNGTTGGVLIFFANTVDLSANITTEGQGFRGGQLNSNNNSENLTDFYYSNTSGNGGEKGEGIAAYIVNKEAGKGPLASGGGGGNAHNNGGAGGGNYGAGGLGGVFEGQVDASRGLGGMALTNPTTDNRIYLGGGSGAGHVNNDAGSPGVAGGGIIIIKANSISGDGFSVNARGTNGIAASGNDGSGGGAAGGTILLDAPLISGTFSINASGGSGGNNIADHGPGGGGGGGLVWSASTIPNSISVNVAGGANGLYLTESNGATSGQNGVATSGLNLVTANNELGEICGNGIDDDCDDLVDCEDPDCSDFDFDGDEVCNDIDLDDDNDGILDTLEDYLGNGTEDEPFVSLYAANKAEASGRYYFNLGSGVFQADVDNSNGGGWVLILQYVHAGGTNPNLNIIGPSSNLPVTSSAALGANEANSNTSWGHLSNEGIAGLDIEELRWYAETSAHSRKIHFKSDVGVEHASTGVGSFDGIQTSNTKYADHTAFLPDVSNAFFTNQEEEALTNFPYWVPGTYHWGIKGSGARWEVDDYPNDFSHSTIHRIWARSSTFPFLDNSADSYSLNLDSDGDGCNDVVEAGFTDGDGDGYLGNSPVTVDENGLVTSASDGYTAPNGGDSPYFLDIEANTGCTDETACNYDETASCDDGSCDFTNCFGCTNETACNYDETATIDDDSCLTLDECGNCGGTQIAGCTDINACNFDPFASCDDGSCATLDECGNCGGTQTTGCTDETACNYDADASCDDDSCEYLTCAGCTDDTACNFDETATIEDDSCLTNDECGNCGGTQTAGCTDETACNYDAAASCDDGSCLTLDECGNCGGTQTTGCTDEMACNYDADASCDDDSCEYLTCAGCTDDTACNFDETATIEDDSCLTNDECGNCGGTQTAGCTDETACNFDAAASCDDGSCLTLDECGNCGGTQTTGCTDETACNYDADASCDDGSCLTNDECGNCGGSETSGCIDETACNFDNTASCDDGSCLYTDECGECGGVGISGCMDDSACNYNANATCESNDCEYDLCTGCMDETACNFDPEATIPAQGCLWLDECGECGGTGSLGCIDTDACNFNADATCNDGSCEYETCGGCTDITACNYDFGTTYDDGSCLYTDECGNCGGFGEAGCMDEEACNFNIDATCSNNSCLYADACGNCGGSDSSGCTDETACNFNPLADCDDASCTFNDCSGCTNEAACNYNPNTDLDDGSCEFNSCAGCMDSEACNYDPNATIDSENCLTQDICGECGGSGVLGCMNPNACNYDSAATCNDDSCDYEDCYGCMDDEACNYDETAVVDNETCLYTDVCGECGGSGISGCTNPAACNFDSTATCNDESCFFFELREDQRDQIIPIEYVSLLHNTVTDYCNADSYLYHITDVETGEVIHQELSYSPNLQLITIEDILYNTLYAVKIAPVINGGSIGTYGPTHYFTTGPVPLIHLDDEFDYENAGSISMESVIYPDRIPYLAQTITWKFTNTEDPQDVSYFSSGAQVSIDNMNISEGRYYVHVRAEISGIVGSNPNTNEAIYALPTEFGEQRIIEFYNPNKPQAETDFLMHTYADGSISINNIDKEEPVNTKMNEPDSEIELLIYPNPTAGEYIQLSKEFCSLAFEITDTTGRLIYNDILNETGVIKFEEKLSSGAYLLHVLVNGERKTERFQVIN